MTHVGVLGVDLFDGQPDEAADRGNDAEACQAALQDFVVDDQLARMVYRQAGEEDYHEDQRKSQKSVSDKEHLPEFARIADRMGI